jgi:hypothetical protein
VLPLRNIIYFETQAIKIKSKNHVCDPQISEFEVTIKTSSNRTPNKNIANKENWSCETDKKNSFWNMYFTIEEKDLQ